MEKFVKTESHAGEHGHWVKEWKADYDPFDDLYMCRVYCSQCGHHGATAFNYCPWCGAELDGKVEVRNEEVRE